MAGGISGNINQLLRNEQKTGFKTESSGVKKPGPGAEKAKNVKNADNKFGDSAIYKLSPEAEMYGKVVDLLQKKYENADVFVAGPDDDLSKIGGELEYSIILNEDEMKLLASDDPKDKEAKDKLMGQIDEAMNVIKSLSEKIGENTEETDEIANFGLKFDKNGKINFFADINGKNYGADSMDSLIQSLMADKSKE